MHFRNYNTNFVSNPRPRWWGCTSSTFGNKNEATIDTGRDEAAYKAEVYSCGHRSSISLLDDNTCCRI
jgi:hypothetical protein